MDGWLIIDKPIGITSNDVIKQIKKLFKGKKIGHAGTLDPLASGILIIAIGEATKLSEYVMSRPKSYQFTIKWGSATTTYDAEGEIIETSPARPTKQQVQGVLADFCPQYYQTPPKFSAIKVGGKRAYDLARAQQDFELTPRLVELNRIEILNHGSDSTELEIDCGRGFYVRSLAIDIGKKLGIPCHVSQLRRTHTGKFYSKDAIPLDLLQKMGHTLPTEEWKNRIHPITYVLDDILVHQVSVDAADSLKRGLKIIYKGLDQEPVFAVSNKKLIAKCQLKGNELIPKRVFN